MKGKDGERQTEAQREALLLGGQAVLLATFPGASRKRYLSFTSRGPNRNRVDIERLRPDTFTTINKQINKLKRIEQLNRDNQLDIFIEANIICERDSKYRRTNLGFKLFGANNATIQGDIFSSLLRGTLILVYKQHSIEISLEKPED